MTIKVPEYEFTLKAPEFQKNDEEFVIWFFEGVIENYPDYVECLMYLGNAYTARGMCEKGLQIDLKLAKLKPYDPLVHYNLACSHSLLNKTSPALAALSNAIKLGYNDIEHLENDDDLDNLKNRKEYKTLIDKLKEAANKCV